MDTESITSKILFSYMEAQTQMIGKFFCEVGMPRMCVRHTDWGEYSWCERVEEGSTEWLECQRMLSQLSDKDREKMRRQVIEAASAYDSAGHPFPVDRVRCCMGIKNGGMFIGVWFEQR